MWPPALVLFRILVSTWITARKYAFTHAYTLMSATTSYIYKDITYKRIDSIVLTFDVASPPQLRTKIYHALLAIAPLPSMAPGTFAVYPIPFVARSLILSVSHKMLEMCHVSNVLIRDTVALTYHAALLKLCMCIKLLILAVSLFIVIVLYSYNP
jgi:hypothetical protein